MWGQGNHHRWVLHKRKAPGLKITRTYMNATLLNTKDHFALLKH